VFTSDLAEDALEQAAYEARLARLMLLRKRCSHQLSRGGQGTELAETAKTESDGYCGGSLGAKGDFVTGSSQAEDAAQYAPALAFQEEEVEKAGYKERKGKEAVVIFEKKAEQTVRSDSDTTLGEGIKSKIRRKRRSSSSLAAEILRRKHAKAREAAQDLGHMDGSDGFE